MEELIKIADVCATDEARARQIIDALRDSGFIIAYSEGFEYMDEFQILVRNQ